MIPSTDYNATILKKDIHTENLFLLTIKTDFLLPGFQAGQFTTLGLKGCEHRFGPLPDPKPITDPQKLIRKSYSIMSSPRQNNFLEFYIALVPEGQLTPRLFLLETNDRIHVGQKFTGKFTMDLIPPHKHLLMISTGTGLAPFISMTRTHFSQASNRHCVLIHGVRHSADLTFYPELLTQEQTCKNFHYVPAVSRPQNDHYWNGPTGRVTDLIKNGIVSQKSGLDFNPENFDVLLCGNPDMIKDMKSYLADIGFVPDHGAERGQIHTEEYW